MYILIYRSSDEPSFVVTDTAEEMQQEIEDLSIDITEFQDTWDDDISFTKFPSNSAFLIKGDLIVPTIDKIRIE